MSDKPRNLIDITLDESSVVRWNPDIDHERRVAIFDLLEENIFRPAADVCGGSEGPYKLALSVSEGRLVFGLSDANDKPLGAFNLPMTPFRRVIREYFAICEAYFDAIKTASPSRIEAIDMGRRGLHNDGSVLLQERLAGKVELDLATARRLFTLICVLHLRA
ncbi:MAG: UPF0262 family protein [Sphingomonadales bacterium]|nr:UPF0262 family protein [Sphingomonadales bacterium]